MYQWLCANSDHAECVKFNPQCPRAERALVKTTKTAGVSMQYTVPDSSLQDCMEVLCTAPKGSSLNGGMVVNLSVTLCVLACATLPQQWPGIGLSTGSEGRE